MKKILWIASIVSIILISCLLRLTSPSGEQRVSYTPSQKECGEIHGSTTARYCIHTAPEGTNGGVVYLLHGRNLDENIWNDDTYYTSLIQKYWSTSGIRAPKIVTVSFGPVWLLTPKNSMPKSGLLEEFVSVVLPEIERKVGVPAYRAIFGESMGGLNSLIAGLRHPALFKKVAALCPGIYVGSPFSSPGEILDFLKRTGADPKVIYGVLRLAREYANGEVEWKQISPIDLLNAVNPPGPEIYLSTALYDKYGNYEGSERFAERAKERGLKIHWRPLYGGHCAVDITSLAEFLR